MANIWHWLSTNWGPLGIGAGVGYCLGAVFNVFKWRYSSWADWKSERQERAPKKIDSKVLQIMRGFNDSCIRSSSEIARAVSMKADDVADSLKRLESSKLLKSYEGTCDDPGPGWTIAYR